MHRLNKELLELIKNDQSVFQFIERSSLDGMWYWDLENPEHEWMSESFWTTLGYDPATKKHLVSEWQDLMHPDDLAMAIENIEKHLADPSHRYDQLVRFKHKNGNTVWIHCRGLATRDENGKPIRMLGAHTDVTELKSKEEALTKTLELRDKFFARMSHEIRTPLFGLIGIAETLKEQVSDPDVLKKLTTMAACGQQLQTLLNDILTLSRLDEEKLIVSKEVVRLSDVVNYLCDLYLPACEKKGISLIIAKQFEQLYVKSDQVRLTQILSNLLSNAIKYTNKGEVKLEWEFLEDNSVRLSVVDNGIGIKNVEMVMGAYSQENNGYEEVLYGTGLGLDIVVKLSNMLGHQFDLQSQFGFGTQASLVLEHTSAPVMQNKATKINTPNNDISGASILVTDDNEINREIVNSMLEQLGCSLDFAKDGQEAIDMVTSKKRQYDIILMDINMPVKDGYKATTEIRSLNSIKQPVIIALSADAFDETLKRCEHHGMNGHLAKPFTKQQLLDTITRLCKH